MIINLRMDYSGKCFTHRSCEISKSKPLSSLTVCIKWGGEEPREEKESKRGDIKEPFVSSDSNTRSLCVAQCHG